MAAKTYFVFFAFGAIVLYGFLFQLPSFEVSNSVFQFQFRNLRSSSGRPTSEQVIASPAELSGSDIKIAQRGSWQCQNLNNLTKDSQEHDKEDSKIMELCVYSAVYDNRIAIGTKPKVRIQVISTLNHEELTGRIQCKFAKAGYVKPDFVSFNRFDLLVPVDIIKTGQGHPGLTHPSSGQRNFYHQLLASCYLPDALEDATHVSLVPPASQMIHTTNALPIVFPSPLTTVEEAGSFEHEFAICVPIAYDTIDPVMLVSWIEMNRLLGVTVINVYNASLGPAADRVFDHYKDFVVVHQIVPPVPERNFDGTGVGSPAALNDCMMRHFNRYRYVLIIDFDELVVPRQSNVTNYQSVLANGRIKYYSNLTDVCSKAIHSYAVKNTFFFKHQPETDYPPHLPYLHYRRRVEKIRKYALGKSFVNPRMCLSAFNHYCLVPLDNTFKSTISVDDALVHHYRNCRVKKKDDCTYSVMLDDVMLRYEGFLTNSVLPVLKQLSLV